MIAMKHTHCTDDEIARAIVDRSDLSAAAEDHFASCDACRAAKEKLEGTLARLSREAARFTPAPETRAAYVVGEERRRTPLVWGLRTVSGMALATLTVIAFIWWYNFSGAPGNGNHLVANGDLFTSDPEMVEVSLLIDNPLSSAYTAIAGEGDGEGK